MIVAIVGFAPDDPHHRTLLQVLGRTMTRGTILVVEDSPQTADTSYQDPVKTAQEFASTISDFSYIVEKEEPPPEPHINGDLSYLYRRPKFISRLPIRKNHRRIIHQPCWRAGRWKSLT